MIGPLALKLLSKEKTKIYVDLIKGRFALRVPYIQLSNYGDSTSRNFFDYS
jgi:hypothetical protein